MKKILALAATLVFLVGLATNAGAQDVKDILKKMVEAQGGRKALEALSDSTVAGSIELVQMGINGSITIYQKYPNKMRIDIDVAGTLITQAFDGEKAWMTNPQTGGTEEMPDLQAKNMRRQATGAKAALHPEELGITYALKGREKANNKEYIILEQTFKDGYKATIWVDPTTYLTYKVRTKSMDATGLGGEVDTESVYEDYQKENNVSTARKIKNIQNGAEVIRMTLSKISYNTKLEDAFFKMTK